MYKIYINETPLILGQLARGETLPPGDDRHLVGRYPGKPKFLLHYVDMLEKSRRWDSITLYGEDVERLFADFRLHFQLIEAAGGVVYDSQDRVLFIYRRLYWDLPKGKIDEGETPEEAALREVREETGLKELIIGPFLGQTYHTYRTGKGVRILKRTHWYAMKTRDTHLTLQTEEDIEKAEWADPETFLDRDPVIYRSILDLLQEVFRKDPD